MEVDIAPTAPDLLAIVAILWQENDSLRERSGITGLTSTKRVFTIHDLSRGRGIGMTATRNGVGSVAIQLDS